MNNRLLPVILRIILYRPLMDGVLYVLKMTFSQDKRFSVQEVSKILADSDSDFTSIDEDSDFEDNYLDCDSDDCFANNSDISAGSNATDDEIDNPQQSEAEEQFAQNIQANSTSVRAC